MKHLITLLIFLGAIFLSPTHSRADPCILSFSVDDHDQIHHKGSRTPKRSLVVDLEGHILTFPSQVIGYTLILENEEGEVFTYQIIGVVFEIPQELKGTYKVIITNGNSHYSGELEL